MTEALVQAARWARLRAAGPIVADYLSLTKPRITLLVLATAAAGFYLGAPAPLDPVLLGHALLGVALVAGGTNAMNQVLEREVDARMARTRGRPLPAGRVSPVTAGAFAGVLAVAGTAYLAVAVNPLTAFLAAITFLIYDLVYTPLKKVHPVATLVGAIPGALPAAGGWAAARGELGPGAWALFAILFFWQLPHFLALAWLFRDDYRRAGLAMLTVADRRGRATRHQALIYTLTLVPVSLVPVPLGLGGTAYFWGALALGVLFLVRAGVFAARPGADTARGLFRYSVLYLPLLLGLLVLDTLAWG